LAPAFFFFDLLTHILIEKGGMRMKEYRVGVIGCTGMVGQRFVTLLARHPWFRLTALAASSRSAGKPYRQAVEGRWRLTEAVPPEAAELTVQDALQAAEAIADACDFVFCAVDLPREQVRELEERYARLECPVISNNSAHRACSDVPMIIPEVNPQHSAVIPAQRRRLGTRRGFIAVKSNCSIQSYVPALHPLRMFGLKKVAVCTYQAVSGAGKTLQQWPEMADNVMPFIRGEEEKSQQEPLKIWGELAEGVILPAVGPEITAQCLRVPVSDGHMAAVFVSFHRPPTPEEAIRCMTSFHGLPQQLQLPSAPRQLIHCFDDPFRPQAAMDRMLEDGMAVAVGRVRPDPVFDLKFVCLSHNTLRGAAGGAVLLAELLCSQGYLE